MVLEQKTAWKRTPLSQNYPDRIRIVFDDHRLVANAGLLLPGHSVPSVSVWLLYTQPAPWAAWSRLPSYASAGATSANPRELLKGSPFTIDLDSTIHSQPDGARPP